MFLGRVDAAGHLRPEGHRSATGWVSAEALQLPNRAPQVSFHLQQRRTVHGPARAVLFREGHHASDEVVKLRCDRGEFGGLTGVHGGSLHRLPCLVQRHAKWPLMPQPSTGSVAGCSGVWTSAAPSETWELSCRGRRPLLTVRWMS